MLSGQESVPAGLRDDIFKEGPRDVAIQQPIAIFRNVVGTQMASSMPRSTNQRNRRLYSSSISIRSLRTEYSTWSNNARNRCSVGSTGGRSRHTLPRSAATVGAGRHRSWVRIARSV
jgi:hypothetical protein